MQFKGKNHDACQNGPHFGAMLGYAHWLDATLQPLLRHAWEAGRAVGGPTLVIFTSDHGDGYTDKGHAQSPSNPQLHAEPSP